MTGDVMKVLLGLLFGFIAVLGWCLCKIASADERPEDWYDDGDQ